MHILHRNPLELQMYFTVTDKKMEKSTNLQIMLSITELVQNSRGAGGGGQERRKQSLEKKKTTVKPLLCSLHIITVLKGQQIGQLMSRFLL